MKIINKVSTIEEMGGKGYQLGLLNKICNVPKFFVISTDNVNELKEKKNGKSS